MSGYTLRAVDGTAVPDVHVLNLNKGTGTISAIDGGFSLSVRDSDTLKFSCVGLQDYYVFVNLSILRPEIVVFLKTDTIFMEEVRISPLPPRRFFRYVFLNTRLPQPEEPELSLRPLLTGDPANVPPTGIIFKGPVQMLYDAFNRNARLERKLRKNREKYSIFIKPEAVDSLVYPDK